MATGTRKKLEETKPEPKNANAAAVQNRTPGTAYRPEPTRTEITRFLDRDGDQQNKTSRNMNAQQLARGLGWFSLGLGIAELLAPRGIARIAGLEADSETTNLIRLFGIRQIASGVGIFMQGEKPSEAVWARVAGDAIDLTGLTAAMASPGASKGRTAFATVNVLAVTALDVYCAQQLTFGNGSPIGEVNLRKSIVIDRPAAELYTFWRNLENLPKFMKDLQSVQVIDQKHSHWVAKGPADTAVEWDAEITDDRPDELIAWRSLKGDVENSGSVQFVPAAGNRGTIVHVEIQYNPPGGVLGAAVAKLFGKEPGQQAAEALRCFRQVIETGEVIVSDGTLWDNGLLTQRPAQPSNTIPELAASSGLPDALRNEI